MHEEYHPRYKPEKGVGLHYTVSYVVSVIEDRVPSLERTAKFFNKEEVPRGKADCY